MALANEIALRGQPRPLVLPIDLTRVDASARHRTRTGGARA